MAASPRFVGLDRRFISSVELAARLGCSRRTVLRYANAGLIPWGVRVGTLRRWDSAKIDTFLASRSQPPRPPKNAKLRAKPKPNEQVCIAVRVRNAETWSIELATSTGLKGDQA